ncbi:MAG: 3-isopropylmalate dehydratase small subunit [Actinobacteria bacterium]|jgi:3-isopropylmalate/(R)-2-methylmalate dehydratase small subunit|uniref:3-isopropylmalate dehydratase n=1 Tax=freshwater metagenome TaxID=449393 RepID=A0A6J6EVT3_9ZZZZ|nr:3-isopropylmalate dehydratase small subunit [Actinomycetota bacterium]
MEAFITHTGIGAPLRRSNVDTDQIIPAEYLKRITRHGYEDALFKAWRDDESFVLNHPIYKTATVLVAGPEFGTGSSREHAVWALMDYGFKVVISPRFADIFRGNSGKGGLLTAQVTDEVTEQLWAYLEADPGAKITVDLPSQQITAGEIVASFEIDPYVKWRLLEGLDDIGITMQQLDQIDTFEQNRASWRPKTTA